MRSILAVVALVFTVACDADPVTWGDPVFRGAPQAPSDAPARLSTGDSAACLASVRVASGGGPSYAAWWSVNRDSSASLVVARLSGSGELNKPVVADSSDHSIRGCGRPPPAIAVDSISGYVHLAYFLEPAAGPGIFFAHSMDSALTFHAAVPIVFGRNPSRVSVAAQGDRVIVAYEDPNAQQPLIGVALSRTMGHLFESRMQATPENGRAAQPEVRLKGDTILLWWSEYSANSAISATRPAYRSAAWR